MRARTIAGPLVSLVLLAALAAGCAASAGGGGAAGADAHAAARRAAEAGRAAEREAAVYVAVLRHYLTSGDHSFGDHRFARVYVLDRARPRAADPMRPRSRDGGAPIQARVRRALADALAGVGTLTFVASGDAVVERRDGCAQVRDGGLLVTLGPVAPAGDRVEVAVNGFVACLAATWLTYVVERDATGWAVRGTTGPVAVA
jgi:hypothetical protein